MLILRVESAAEQLRLTSGFKDFQFIESTSGMQ